MIEVHDFAKMTNATKLMLKEKNKKKQFGMSIDVKVSRDGTMPVSIPGEKNSQYDSGGGGNTINKNLHHRNNQNVDTHNLEVTTMTTH